MPFLIQYGTAPKKSEEENQDRYHIAPNNNLAAIADGAGGYGAYVGQWADTLLKALPTETFDNAQALHQWLMPIATQFFEQYQPIAQQHDFTYAKFLDEGSAATLTAAWLNPSTQQLNIWLYGDSPYMLLDHQTNILQMPPSLSQLSAFSNKTQHLNWNADHAFKPNHAHTQQLTLNTHQTLLLATDALAQFILIRYLLSQPHNTDCKQQLTNALQQNGLQAQLISANQHLNLPFEELISQLRNTLQTPNNPPDNNNFKTLLYQWFDQGLIEEDDYTLISITYNSSTDSL